MGASSVTSKGQVTIPQEVRQKLGIRQGTRVDFRVVNDHVELRLVSVPVDLPKTGFGLLKARRKPVPTDFDVATVAARVKRKRAR